MYLNEQGSRMSKGEGCKSLKLEANSQKP